MLRPAPAVVLFLLLAHLDHRLHEVRRLAHVAQDPLQLRAPGRAAVVAGLQDGLERRGELVQHQERLALVDHQPPALVPREEAVP